MHTQSIVSMVCLTLSLSMTTWLNSSQSYRVPHIAMQDTLTGLCLILKNNLQTLKKVIQGLTPHKKKRLLSNVFLFMINMLCLSIKHSRNLLNPR